MIVIADTGPLNYLILIQAVDVLPSLYGRIVVPSSVCEELSRSRAPETVRRWITRPPDWLEMRAPNSPPDAALIAAGLDPGERDAILLAEELRADRVILDDLAGRKEAKRRHLAFTGTLGVLSAAAERGLLDLTVAVEALRQTTFHVSQNVLDHLLADQVTILYRPVGQKEYELIAASGFQRFPPRLPEQPIFYPVTNESYATQIARDWNTKDDASGRIGYVLRFRVRSTHLRKYEPRVVGAAVHNEYWIPADELHRFNDAIVGLIETIAMYRN